MYLNMGSSVYLAMYFWKPAIKIYYYYYYYHFVLNGKISVAPHRPLFTRQVSNIRRTLVGN